MNLDPHDLFLRALEMAPGRRAAFLAKACGDNHSLRQEIDRLLEDAERADALFEAGQDAVEESLGLEREGDQIGPYTLQEKLGEGGFGVVWRATQSCPIARVVALKVTKAGMDTRAVLARFEAERQALALMDHPNIAKVLDAGATPGGRPYFAMELVQGVPIIEFSEEHRLDLRARLELFQQVCMAVNHAHQKGIIHRDLKPSNVLVSSDGERPVPKVIDFGIAKATQGKLTDATLVTRIEHFLGTPAYMSPEQATRDGSDLDTRSDIYSLGVLLYELLAGLPPFDPKTLLEAGYEEMRGALRRPPPCSGTSSRNPGITTRPISIPTLSRPSAD